MCVCVEDRGVESVTSVNRLDTHVYILVKDDSSQITPSVSNVLVPNNRPRDGVQVGSVVELNVTPLTISTHEVSSRIRTRAYDVFTGHLSGTPRDNNGY